MTSCALLLRISACKVRRAARGVVLSCKCCAHAPIRDGYHCLILMTPWPALLFVVGVWTSCFETTVAEMEMVQNMFTMQERLRSIHSPISRTMASPSSTSAARILRTPSQDTCLSKKYMPTTFFKTCSLLACEETFIPGRLDSGFKSRPLSISSLFVFSVSLSLCLPTASFWIQVIITAKHETRFCLKWNGLWSISSAASQYSTVSV